MILAQKEIDELMQEKVDLEIALASNINKLLAEFTTRTKWYVNNLDIQFAESTTMGDEQPVFIVNDVSIKLIYCTKGGERVFIS
jgi:hypothetical protein